METCFPQVLIDASRCNIHQPTLSYWHCDVSDHHTIFHHSFRTTDMFGERVYLGNPNSCLLNQSSNSVYGCLIHLRHLLPLYKSFIANVIHLFEANLFSMSTLMPCILPSCKSAQQLRNQTIIQDCCCELDNPPFIGIVAFNTQQKIHIGASDVFLNHGDVTPSPT